MSTVELKHPVSQLRDTLRGQWTRYNFLKEYLNDVFHLMNSLDKYCETQDREVEVQRNNRKPEIPARGPNGCKILITSFVGKASFMQKFCRKTFPKS